VIARQGGGRYTILLREDPFALSGLRGLGSTPIGPTVVGASAPIAAAAVTLPSVSSALGLGAAAGPIGAGIGVLVGVIAGLWAAHDARANRPGLFLEALDGVKAAKNAGFFVVVTTTIYPDTDVRDVAGLCEKLHAMHVDGYMLSPHYPAEKMCRNTAAAFHEKMQKRFREASELLSEYNLLTSPIYMEYLRGERELDCCSWGSPVYGPRGWAAPCSQLGYGYEEHYKSLLENTVWENFGRGMNPQCEPCASHSGYETAAILGMNPKTGDFWKMVAWQLEGGLGEKRERARKG